MAHTTRVYVVDKQGRLRLTFPYGMAAEDMTRDIRRLLEE
jgi:cytochrome oxidase Cu insertion factor (SCO1/SenC/PrrC family)